MLPGCNVFLLVSSDRERLAILLCGVLVFLINTHLFVKYDDLYIIYNASSSVEHCCISLNSKTCLLSIYKAISFCSSGTVTHLFFSLWVIF